MCGFLGLEDFVRVIHGRESYGRADSKEYANEQKDKQKRVRRRKMISFQTNHGHFGNGFGFPARDQGY